MNKEEKQKLEKILYRFASKHDYNIAHTPFEYFQKAVLVENDYVYDGLSNFLVYYDMYGKVHKEVWQIGKGWVSEASYKRYLSH